MITRRFEVNGKKASLLGYGAMRLPTVDGGHANPWAPNMSNKDIDQKLVNRQVRRMLELGINYFDVAPVYCRGEAEQVLGEALRASGAPRESYILASKLSNFDPSQHPLAACKEIFATSLKRLHTDYIDNYVLHNIGIGGYENFLNRYVRNGAADWCAELRAQGKIRNLGFSYHGDRRAWDWCIEHHGKYKWDHAIIQMNYVDWEHGHEVNEQNLDAKYLYETLTSLKIPVVIMEPLLGGTLARYNWSLANELTPLDPEATLASWAFRFCGSFDNVMVVLSGMTREEHIEENARTFSPLRACTARELEALSRAARAFVACKTVPCTSCQYCMPCPYGLDIPALLSFRNQYLTKDGGLSKRQVLKAYEKAVPEALRRADHCTGCGRCTPHCPQQIDIPKEIAAIDEKIDILRTEAAK